MKQVQEPGKCQHEACSCETTDTNEYCSEDCETAAKGGPEMSCQCGHPECGE